VRDKDRVIPGTILAFYPITVRAGDRGKPFTAQRVKGRVAMETWLYRGKGENPYRVRLTIAQDSPPTRGILRMSPKSIRCRELGCGDTSDRVRDTPGDLENPWQPRGFGR